MDAKPVMTSADATFSAIDANDAQLQDLRAQLQRLKCMLNKSASRIDAAAVDGGSVKDETMLPAQPIAECPGNKPGNARWMKKPATGGDDQRKAAAGRKAKSDAQELRHRMDFLLELASRPENLLSPQDRKFALDVLSALLPEVAECLCGILIERLLVMEAPPRALLMTVLDHASAADKRRLAEEARLPDDLLQELICQQDENILKGIVRRRLLPACATWELARHASPDILHDMLRNGGAVMTETCWWRLLERAMSDRTLHAPLVMRSDLPRHVALELFWHVEDEQRRHILSRYASDSQQTKELLKAAGFDDLQGDVDFLADLHVILGILSERNWKEAAWKLSEKTGLHAWLCARVLRDKGGEALAMMIKAHGVSTRDFVFVLENMQRHCLASHWTFLRQSASVESLYGTISIRRARMVLLYWDWRCREAGPYRYVNITTAGDEAFSVVG